MENVNNQNQALEPIAWYAVGVFNNHERIVAEELTSKLTKPEFANDFVAAVLIGETVTEERTLKNGTVKKKEVFVNDFPGYVLLRARLTNEMWYAVRNSRFVSGIMGSSGKGAKAIPIDDAVMNPHLRKIGRTDLIVRNDVNFKAGDKVLVTEGPFSGKEGIVEKFDSSKNVATIIVEIMNGSASLVVDVDTVRRI